MQIQALTRLTTLGKLVVRTFIAFGAFVLAGFIISESRPSLTLVSMAFTYGAITLLFSILFKTERSSWRFTSLHDLQKLLRAAVLTVLTFLLVEFAVQRALTLPRSVLVLAALLDFLSISAARILRRVVNEGRSPLSIFRNAKAEVDAEPLLLVGDIASAEDYLRALSRRADNNYRVIGVIADEERDVGLEIRGASVLGAAPQLETIAHSYAKTTQTPIAILFLDEGVAARHTAQAVRLKAAGIRLLRLPSIREMDGITGATDVREISVEELLARKPVKLDINIVRQLVAGKRVLITGAGGSIGSEISRQVAAVGCSYLTLLDQSEFGLFSIDKDIATRYPNLAHRAALCDVRDKERLASWMKTERPDIVFHAAALKHVHLVEQHPAEGVFTNVFGTRNVAEAASRCGAKQVVLISTDKAVDPTCVMGATKRIAETIIRGQPATGGPKFSVVRFGNVLGSAGSVVPIFKDQIERGGPVTVTDPNVERFFMTIPEAVELVLHATAQSAAKPNPQSAIFVLDMGEPVKIVDLATRMIELSGKVPGSDIAIEFVGLKPGEKMTEELVDSTEVARPVAAGVFEVTDRLAGKPLTATQLSKLETIARGGGDDAVRAAVFEVLTSIRTSAQTVEV
jgi:O-antigen biosynthesis protein WbqV